MRINEGFELRKVCDENVIVAYGRKNIDFSKVYDIDAQTALNDASEMAEKWKELGLVSD